MASTATITRVDNDKLFPGLASVIANTPVTYHEQFICRGKPYILYPILGNGSIYQYVSKDQPGMVCTRPCTLKEIFEFWLPHIASDKELRETAVSYYLDMTKNPSKIPPFDAINTMGFNSHCIDMMCGKYIHENPTYNPPPPPDPLMSL